MRQRLEFTEQDVQSIIAAYITEQSLRGVSHEDVILTWDEPGKFVAVVETDDDAPC